jgi:hypothetical protein
MPFILFVKNSIRFYIFTYQNMSSNEICQAKGTLNYLFFCDYVDTDKIPNKSSLRSKK